MHYAGGGGGATSSEGWWQGLDVPADVQEMDKETVRGLADELQTLLEDLQRNSSPGSPQDLNQTGTQAASGQAFGAWDVAAEMHSSYVDAHDKIMGCYNELVGQLSAAIETLHLEIRELEGTDQASMIQGEVPPAGYPASTEDPATLPGMNA